MMKSVEYDSTKGRFEIDPAFLDASQIRPVKYFGGMYPEFTDNWN